MEDFGVACPLVPSVPHLVSGSCSSPRTFAPRCLQTPPHGDALALRLSFGSTSTWTGDSHPRALRHARHTRLRDKLQPAPKLPYSAPPETATNRCKGRRSSNGRLSASSPSWTAPPVSPSRLWRFDEHQLFLVQAPQGTRQVPRPSRMDAVAKDSHRGGTRAGLTRSAGTSRLHARPQPSLSVPDVSCHLASCGLA
jgi:hypothetical protein